MKGFKYSFLALVGIVVLFSSSCCTTEEVVQGKVEPPKNVNIKEINSGVLTGNGEEPVGFEKGYVIQSQEEWEALREKMNAVNYAQGEVSIDFEGSTVLAYFDKIRPNGGYTIKIMQVIESDDVVKAMHKSKAPEGMATDIMTQPFHIVSIPKSKKTIKFEAITE